MMSKPAQISVPPVIIEPEDGWNGQLRKRRFKKICSIHPSKNSPIPYPPSGKSGGLQHSANLQYSIPHTVFIVHKRRPKAKYCIETESSSSNAIKRKQASTSAHNIMQQLTKPRPLDAPAAPSILPLGRPLAAAPSLPRLATGRAIPKLSLQ